MGNLIWQGIFFQQEIRSELLHFSFFNLFFIFVYWLAWKQGWRSLGRNVPGNWDAGIWCRAFLTANYNTPLPIIIRRFVWLIHCQGQIRSSGSLALVSKGDIQLIILCSSAQECRGELSVCWGTDRFITPLSAVSWAWKGQQWKAASLSAEHVKPCLAETSKSWWLPPPGSSFPFPFPLFCPPSRQIKALYSSSGSCTPELLQLCRWFLFSTFCSLRKNM